jgi:hypothetical protein
MPFTTRFLRPKRIRRPNMPQDQTPAAAARLTGQGDGYRWAIEHRSDFSDEAQFLAAAIEAAKEQSEYTEHRDIQWPNEEYIRAFWYAAKDQWAGSV